MHCIKTKFLFPVDSITLIASSISDSEASPVAKKIGFLVFAIFSIISSQVISPEPILMKGTSNSIHNSIASKS